MIKTTIYDASYIIYTMYYTVNISYMITIYIYMYILYLRILCIIFNINAIYLTPYIHNHHIYCKYVTYMINVFMVGSENPPHFFNLPHQATTKMQK